MSAEPVKIVLERRVCPDAMTAFEAWAREVVQGSRAYALEGSFVLTRGEDCLVLLRFPSQEDLERWRAAPEVQAVLARGDAFSKHPPRAPAIHTGLETWFTIAGQPAAALPPPRWKMALVTWLALMPLVVATGQVVPAGWPFLPRLALSTLIPVCALTWVVMPNVARLLHGWLRR